MSTVAVATPVQGVSTHTLTQATRAAILSVTVLVALMLYYFIGVDEGMTSVFGNTMVIHEWVHDGRHFLGFPCH